MLVGKVILKKEKLVATHSEFPCSARAAFRSKSSCERIDNASSSSVTTPDSLGCFCSYSDLQR